MINAAMIGLGWWGKHSIDSIKMSEKIKITGACSRNTENHKDFLSEMVYISIKHTKRFLMINQ